VLRYLEMISEGLALTESYEALSLDEIIAQLNELGCLLRNFLTQKVCKNLLT
jgi:hypothetical protein